MTPSTPFVVISTLFGPVPDWQVGFMRSPQPPDARPAQSPDPFLNSCAELAAVSRNIRSGHAAVIVSVLAERLDDLARSLEDASESETAGRIAETAFAIGQHITRYAIPQLPSA